MESVNFSINGVAGTLWEIRRQEASHFYLGYRQALLISKSLKRDLKLARLTGKKISVEIEGCRSKLNDSLGELEKEILLSEIEIAEDSLADNSTAIRDIELELSVAESEARRILGLHPDLGNTYDAVQERYSQEAFLGKLARSVAISTYSLLKGVPESAAETLVDSDSLPEQDRRKLFDLWSEKMNQLIPVEHQEQILETAKNEAMMEGVNGTVFRGN